MAIQYWLMKGEPEVFSLSQLEKDKTTWWEGVRNYQARNFMMKNMQIGDAVLFYHSNAEPPGIAGLASVSALAQPDLSQFDPTSEYHEPRASKDKPIWYCVQVKFSSRFKNYVSLDQLRSQNALTDMLVLRPGQRLSIQPVTKTEFEVIRKLGES